MRILVHVLLSALAVFVTARLLPGAAPMTFGTSAVVAVVLGIINATIKPLLLLLTLPINILTLGLFTFVINGAMIELAARLVPGFHVASFLWAMGFAVVLGIVNLFLHSIEPH